MTPKMSLVPLTPGALDLAGKVVKKRQYLVGPGAIEASLEVFALVQLGVAKVNGHHLILRHGGRRALERALAQNSDRLNAD